MTDHTKDALPWAYAVNTMEGTDQPANWRILFGEERYGSCFTHEPLYSAKSYLAAMASKPAAPDYERMRHIANEWADMASNGLQWARNLRDGICTAQEAVDALTSNMTHCRKVNDAPGRYGQPVLASPPPEPVASGAAWLVEAPRVGWWDGRLVSRGIDPRFFTTDPNQAIRFLRKEDAEKVVAAGGSNLFATQHMWIASLPAEPVTSDSRAARLDAAMKKLDAEGPLPGMIAAFELHYGQKWTDPDWRREASTWASSWAAALATPPPEPAAAPQATAVIATVLERFKWVGPYKAYEDTYEDGWKDARNEIEWALAEALGPSPSVPPLQDAHPAPQATAPAPTQPQQAAELPELTAWRQARRDSIAAVEAYNAALLEARAKDEINGFGFTNVNAEFKVMTDASNLAHQLVRPLLDALAGAPPAPAQQELTDEEIDSMNQAAQDAAISSGIPPHRALVRAALAQQGSGRKS